MAMSARALKALAMLIRLLQLVLALFIVGVASFHVYQFSRNHLRVDGGSGQLPHALYAIEVISCFAALFALITLLTTFLGHKKFFILTLATDLLLTGGFIALSVLLRGSSRQSCRTAVWSPAVSKSTNNLPAALYYTTTTTTTTPRTRASPRLLCNLDKASFALSIALAVLFAATMALALCSYRASSSSSFGGVRVRGSGSSHTQKPFARASEETAAYANTAGGYDAPGFRGPAEMHHEYRAATPVAADYPGDVENGRFDPALRTTAEKEGGYGNGSRNF